MTHVANLIYTIACSLATSSRDIKIKEVGYGRHRIIIITCPKKDVGYLVGKFGQSAKAMRVIAYNLGVRIGIKYRVEIEEEKQSA